MGCVTEALFAQAVADRRWLHAHPEVDFDLEQTAAYIRSRLDGIGVLHEGDYGTCAVCAHVGDVSGRLPIVALRADMDALPIQEASGVPYASLHPGKMHACGHDSHAAVMLAVARVLKSMEGDLPCGVRMFFQPSEEGVLSGARMMVEHGAMDGVACVVGLHCENTLPTGTIGLHAGDYMAACAPVEIAFIGRPAHAALRTGGVDAVAMAVRAYDAMARAVAEEAGERPYIWSVGCFNGGTAHNIIPGRCELKITFRYFDQAFADRAMTRVEAVCAAIAANAGGSAEVKWHVSAPPVINDAAIVERLGRAARARGLPVVQMPSRMSSEDFSWYLTKAPGALFRFGTRNEALGSTMLAHRADFCIDEDGMRAAIEAFVAFVLDYRS